MGSCVRTEGRREQGKRRWARVSGASAGAPPNCRGDEHHAVTGKMYGKVTVVRPLGDARQEADIRFTSLSQDAYDMIRQIKKIP